MTDDHTNAANNSPKQAEPSVSKAPISPTTAGATSKPMTPESQVKKVDIVIAGVTYPIYCPIHEQEELLSAVSYINNYALDLRREAPSLSQESLLVLCCLNLYEKILTLCLNKSSIFKMPNLAKSGSA